MNVDQNEKEYGELAMQKVFLSLSPSTQSSNISFLNKKKTRSLAREGLIQGLSEYKLYIEVSSTAVFHS